MKKNNVQPTRGLGLIAILAGALLLTPFRLDAEEMCEPIDLSIPYLETLKSIFYGGDFDVFFDSTGLGTQEEIESFAKTMDSAIPEGFEKCETVMSEQLSSKLVEELVIFDYSGGAKLFLYLIAANTDLDWAVLHFHTTTEFSDVMGMWK